MAGKNVRMYTYLKCYVQKRMVRIELSEKCEKQLMKTFKLDLQYRTVCKSDVRYFMAL